MRALFPAGAGQAPWGSCPAIRLVAIGVLLLAGAFFPGPGPLSAQEFRPTQVAIQAPPSGDPRLDPALDFVADTLAFVLATQEGYAVVSDEPDYLVNARVTAAETQGATVYRVSVSVEDLSAGAAPAEFREESTGIFDLLNAADIVADSVLEEITGREINYGALVFSFSSPPPDYRVRLNQGVIEGSPSRFDRVAEGRYNVRVEASISDVSVVLLDDVVQVQGETEETVDVTVPDPEILQRAVAANQRWLEGSIAVLDPAVAREEAEAALEAAVGTRRNTIYAAGSVFSPAIVGQTRPGVRFDFPLLGQAPPVVIEVDGDASEWESAPAVARAEPDDYGGPLFPYKAREVKLLRSGDAFYLAVTGAEALNTSDDRARVSLQLFARPAEGEGIPYRLIVELPAGSITLEDEDREQQVRLRGTQVVWGESAEIMIPRQAVSGVELLDFRRLVIQTESYTPGLNTGRLWIEGR